MRYQPVLFSESTKGGVRFDGVGAKDDRGVTLRLVSESHDASSLRTATTDYCALEKGV